MTPDWRCEERVLLVGGRIHAPGTGAPTAMLVDGERIAWVGTDVDAEGQRRTVDRIVHLDGALVTPGFVDAHVHNTSTGLTLSGLDLTRASSLTEALDLLQARARDLRGGTIIGHGWDETRWPELRPPTREEVDRASWGSVVYLSRIDVHSAAVSSSLVAAVAGVSDLAGWHPSDPLSRAAHHAVREAVLGTLTSGQRRAAQRLAREHAASLGIVALHEMAGPLISGEADLMELLGLSATEPGPLVAGYWGELARDGGVARARDLGAVGAGGDLFVDGAIGSRTACLCAPYSDAPSETGAAYHDAEAVAEHVVAATQAGMQAGFHVIGDAAAGTVMTGLRSAAARVGREAMRSAQHRLEHAEMLSDEDIAGLADLGVTASMQPMFDALWGGADGMYVRRLGAARAGAMNRFADLSAAGVLLAFGSDAPVTDLGPWAAVRAAARHTVPGQSLSVPAAFVAHTRGGWQAIGAPDTGTLTPGAPAHYVVWAADAPADASAEDGDLGLPALHDGPLPRALRTVVAGTIVHDTGDLADRADG